MWCLGHQAGRGQALSDLGVNSLGACIKVISGLAKSYFNRTLCNNNTSVMNKDQFLYRKWHLKVTETLSHMHGNPDLLRVLEGVEWVWDLCRPSSRLCAPGELPELQLEQPEGVWMIEEATECDTGCVGVDCYQVNPQFTTSSPVWALASCRCEQTGPVCCGQKLRKADRLRFLYNPGRWGAKAAQRPGNRRLIGSKYCWIDWKVLVRTAVD